MAKNILILSAIGYCCAVLLLVNGINGMDSGYQEKLSSYSEPFSKIRINDRFDLDEVAGSVTNNDDIMDNEDHVLQAIGNGGELIVKKRAPSGFTGMRGKKCGDPEATDQEALARGINWSQRLWNHWQLAPEQSEMISNTLTVDDDDPPIAPNTMPPVGNVWRKQLVDAYELDRMTNWLKDFEAKYPSKTLPEFFDRVAVASAYLKEATKRAPSGFMGMRGKRSMADDLAVADALGANYPLLHVDNKKNMPAFFGVRGKKQPFSDLRNKFVGVRGKKSHSEETTKRQSRVHGGDDEWQQQQQQQQQRPMSHVLENSNRPRRFLFMMADTKRAPIGFQGMRGKRPVHPEENNTKHE